MADTVQKTDNDDMHEAMAAAYEEVVGAGEPELKPNEPVEAPAETVKSEPVEEPAPDEGAAAGRARDPKTGKFIPKTGDEPAVEPEEAVAPVAKPVVKPPGPVATKPVVAVAPPEGVKPPPAVGDLSRAPQSWRAQAREHWAALDTLGEAGRAVKEEAHRRERETNVVLQKTAEARTFHEEFQRVLQPFAPIIAANGHTPLQSVQGLMQTAAALQMGPPGQKAAVVASIIRNYAIDLDMLSQALEPGGVPQGAPQGQQGYDPRVDQILAQQQRQAYEAQQWAQQDEARQVRELQAHYEKFAETHEFFPEVRQLMSTIVSVKMGQEGVDIPDEEAYKMALALRPDLTQILKQREELAQATNPNGSTARAAAAAVSLKPGTITARKAANPDDLHAVMAESYDEVYGDK